jgi:hypothetical protein
MKYEIRNLVADKPQIKMRPRIFDDLYVGELFQLQRQIDEKIYIRISTIFTEDKCFNSIDLSSGEAWHFAEDEKVSVYTGSVVFDENAFNDKIEI